MATCSISVGAAVQVQCASPATPYLLDAPAAPSLRSASPDAGRVTVYFCPTDIRARSSPGLPCWHARLSGIMQG